MLLRDVGFSRENDAAPVSRGQSRAALQRNTPVPAACWWFTIWSKWPSNWS